MILAIFEPVMAVQKRLGHINGSDFTADSGPMGRAWVCTKPNFKTKSLNSYANSQLHTLKKVEKTLQLRKSG
jgi:hypothetical protein